MADDSLEIIEPFDYHPCDTPRGCVYYDFDVLTGYQQNELNKLKIRTMRQDEKYLAAHPEVRAFVALILRYVLIRRPRQNIQHTIESFFKRPSYKIIEEVENYIINRGRTVDQEEEEAEEEEYEMEDEMEKYFSAIDLQAREDEAEEEESVEAKGFVKKEVNDFEFMKSLILEKINEFPSATNTESDSNVESGGSTSIHEVASEVLNVIDYATKTDVVEEEDVEVEKAEEGEEEGEEEFEEESSSDEEVYVHLQ